MADSPSRKAQGVVTLTLKSNGSEIKESIGVLSVEVRRSVNAVPSARIEIRDGDAATDAWPVSDDKVFAPGAAVTVLAGYGGQQEAIFEGVVVKVGIRVSGNNDGRLVVECRDKSVRMTGARHSANHIDASDSEIIGKLIAAHGLSSDTATTGPKHRELVQYQCTDWDFMVARAEVNGLLVTARDGKVSVKAPDVDGTPVLKVEYGDDLIDFRAEIDARTQFAAVQASAWDPGAQQVALGAVAKPGGSGTPDGAELAKVLDAGTITLPTGSPLVPAVLEDWASAQQVKAGLSRVRGHLRFQGSAKALPGGLIEVKGLGKRYDGKVFIVGVEHEIADGNWFTRAEFGLAPGWFVERPDVAAPAAAGWVPAARGLQIGKVLKLDGDPAGQHRIQIELPVLQAQTKGIWARLMQFHASDGFGAFFVPEVGDEVVVAYLGDDPSAPVVLGGLYSSLRKPPHPLTEKNAVKAIVTRCQARIEIDDEAKVITVKTPQDNQVVLSDKEKSIVMSDQHGNKVVLSDAGISIESPKDIKIDAKGKVTIDAAQSVAIEAKADVSVKGTNVGCKASVGFTAEGSASAQLTASGQTTVKGAMVMIN
jgi:Rhs element Vgr protein